MSNKEMKIKLLCKEGFDPSQMSQDDWLNEAIKADEIAKACGPFDPAYNVFKHQSDRCLDAAQYADT